MSMQANIASPSNLIEQSEKMDNSHPARQLPTVVPLEIQIGTCKRNFYLFDTPISQAECSKILQGTSYPLPPFIHQIKTIVDIGANIGAATVYFAMNYPSAHILSFEPDPDCYKLLKRNTEDLLHVSTFNIGLSDQSQQAQLFLGQIDPATNSLLNSALNSHETISITLQDIRKILTEQSINEIDLLKIDTEGNELPILKALELMLPSIRIIYIEYHSEHDRLEIDRLLHSTHILCYGSITFMHRGELCYLLRQPLPKELEQLEIKSAREVELI